jgi:peptidoglycan/LPS O-acetylase OafA/YrhL
VLLGLNAAAVIIRVFKPEWIDKESDTIEAAESTAIKVVHFFDPVKNYKWLVGEVPESKNPDLMFFSGIRFCCMLWVIIGHTFYYAKYAPLTNPTEILDFMKKFWHSYLTNATYSVDVFFFMSGFFAFYLVFNEILSKNGMFSVWRVYAHRLIRMSPLYFCIVIAFTWIFPTTVSGPMKFAINDEIDSTCKKSWYANLMYFNNLVPPKEECAGWLCTLQTTCNFSC